MANKSIPDRYQFSAIPHIFINDASAAIEFYVRAFGASEIFRVSKPDAKIVHAEIRIGSSVVMVGDAEGLFSSPHSLGGVSVGLHVYTDNVDELLASALAAGAIEIDAAKDMFYGDRMGMVQDPFGYIWVFLTHQEEMAPQEIKRRGEALFK